MKAVQLFNIKETQPLRFGGSVTVFMDCYVPPGFSEFEKKYVFSWIAFDPKEPQRRILIDQHQGRPCHLHIDLCEQELNPKPKSLPDAYQHFLFQIKKKFGELA